MRHRRQVLGLGESDPHLIAWGRKGFGGDGAFKLMAISLLHPYMSQHNREPCHLPAAVPINARGLPHRLEAFWSSLCSPVHTTNTDTGVFGDIGHRQGLPCCSANIRGKQGPNTRSKQAVPLPHTWQ